MVEDENYKQFRPGRRYEVKIVHLGSDPTYWGLWCPDYDYQAEIEAVSLPDGVVMVIDDPDGILGVHGCSCCPEPDDFYAEGKTAYVNLLKVEITEAPASIVMYNGIPSPEYQASAVGGPSGGAQ